MVYLRRAAEERCAWPLVPLTCGTEGRCTLSPVDVARDVLARIEPHAAFNAFLAVDSDGVIATAKQSEICWRRVRHRAGAAHAAGDRNLSIYEVNKELSGGCWRS